MAKSAAKTQAQAPKGTANNHSATAKKADCGCGGPDPAECHCHHAADEDSNKAAKPATPSLNGAAPDFSRMTTAEKLAYNKARRERIFD